MVAQEQLFMEGVAIGMCDKFRDNWGAPDTKELCHKFFAGMDFCIQHNWPSIDTIKRLFDTDELASNGVYVTDGTSKGQAHVCVLGDADVHVYVPANGVCDVYARHDSKVHLHVGENAFCYVTILDNTAVDIEDKLNRATVKCSYFSGTIINKELFDTIHDKNKEK